MLTYFCIIRTSPNGSQWYWDTDENCWRTDPRAASRYNTQFVAKCVANVIAGHVVRVVVDPNTNRGRVEYV